MDNIEDILRALAEDDDEQPEEHSEANSEEGGLFSGLDPEMLMRMLSLFEMFNQPSDNERFLLALKPLLREENRPKIDSAVRLLKLFSLLPVLRESGLFEKLL
ncbi:MAG: hypothetical protein K2N38_05615 [Oscillospiraceae bacterium]|nr:hypothetical protein [Oscillospiraceae bacterium]